jgi:hypothetical protein
MEEKQAKEETKRLTFVVVFMSMFVLVLFGFAPTV